MGNYILHVVLQAGLWDASASPNPSTILCRLAAGTGPEIGSGPIYSNAAIVTLTGSVSYGGYAVTFPMLGMAALSDPSTDISLLCAGSNAYASRATFTAIQAEAITQMPQWQ